LPEIYDEEYFEYGVSSGKSGYENYRWLPDRLHREARALINLLGIDPGAKVLDFGCAKGYLVKALRNYGIEAYGCDVSEYALKMADESVKEYLTQDIPDMEFDYIISRNTLEHIGVKELKEIMRLFQLVTGNLFFSVPLIDPQTGDYVMQMPDKTHKIRWTNAQWMSFAEKCGWIYVTSYPHVDGFHDNFKNYPNAMGLYVCKNENIGNNPSS
jgi:cyclopropane fatty-acyl-phospholipid synthase-like methyltransferase